MATTPRRMMTSQEHAASLRAHPLPPPPPHFYPWLATGTLAAYLRHYATDDPEMRAILEPAHAAMAALEARRRAALRAEGTGHA